MCFFEVHIYIYIYNSRVDFFNNKRPSKRQREELEVPRITLNAPSTSNDMTPSEDSPNNIIKNDSKKAECLAFKLDRLRDKAGRYNSHHSFLTRCISENIIPNGLKLELEPTIGNHDEEFLNNWYNKLQKYSLDFMNDIVVFCNQTNANLANEIKSTENELQQLLEKDTFQEIQNTINTNQTIRDRSLKQRKLKKFNHLKYKPRQTQHSGNQENFSLEEHQPNENKTSYANALRKGSSKTNLFRRKSNTSIRRSLSKTNTDERKDQLPITHQLDIRNKQTDMKKKNSETTLEQQVNNESNSEVTEMQKQIEVLSNEIKQLKTQSKQGNGLTQVIEQEPQTTVFSPQPPTPRKIRILQRGDNATTPQAPKNLQSASAVDRGVTKDDIKEVMSLIQNTMQALTVFEKRFSEQKSI